jgi:hypothetical protein
MIWVYCCELYECSEEEIRHIQTVRSKYDFIVYMYVVSLLFLMDVFVWTAGVMRD